MNETQTIAPPPVQGRVPTVYFIDDSATMREVIKIAFRKENVHIIACADAASALSQFASAAPDAVITDVIMPDKDGYQVCEFIKQHARFAQTPVLLMSGVVNRDVAEKAMAVKADDLIRKPFQPQDLVSRVKAMLAAKFPVAAGSAPPSAPGHNPSRAADVATSERIQPLRHQDSGSGTGSPYSVQNPLADFFSPSAAANSSNVAPCSGGSTAPPTSWSDRTAPSASSAGVSAPGGGASSPQSPASSHSSSSSIGISDRSTPPSTQSQPRASSQGLFPSPQQPATPSSVEVQRLRSEVLRLELLVKKLQAELEAEHQYCAALESHLKSLQG